MSASGRARPLALCLAAQLSAVGCSVEKPFDFKLLQVNSPKDGAACTLVTQDLASRYTLRLSVLRRPTDKPRVSQGRVRDWNLICDLKLPPKSPPEPIEFQIPTGSSEEATLRVEAFDGNDVDGYELKFSGQVHDVDLNGSGTTVYLHETNSASCLQGGTWTSAFHSATVLPNGSVALVGGVQGAGGRGEISNGQFFTQSSVAIFDPSELSWQMACQPAAEETEESGELALPGRAFHNAVLLPSNPRGPYRLLLLGGLTANVGDPVAIERRDGTMAQPFRISPSEQSRAAEAGILTLTFAGSGCAKDGEPRAVYEPVADLSAVKGLFPATTLIDGGQALFFVGGATSYTPSGEQQGFASEGSPLAHVLTLEPEPRLDHQIELRRIRAGHALARTAQDTAFALGGVMDGGSSELDAEQGEALTLESPSVPLAVENIAAVTAWHTLSEIGVTDRELALGEAPAALLLYGGYELDPGKNETFRFAVNAASAAAQLLTVGQSPSATPYDTTGDVGPALEVSAYHQATGQADGSVLITGGNVNKRCPLGPGKAPQLDRCAASQLALFERTEDGLLRRRLPEDLALRVARYGHRATRLLDNTVLISGGLEVNAESLNLRLVAKEALFERFSFLTGASAETYFINLLPDRERPPAEEIQPCERRE